jgi:hypothetical protein
LAGIDLDVEIAFMTIADLARDETLHLALTECASDHPACSPGFFGECGAHFAAFLWTIIKLPAVRESHKDFLPFGKLRPEPENLKHPNFI